MLVCETYALYLLLKTCIFELQRKCWENFKKVLLFIILLPKVKLAITITKMSAYSAFALYPYNLIFFVCIHQCPEQN